MSQKTYRTAGADYAAGYSARQNNQPIPANVSRRWAQGYRDAWRAGK